MITLEERERKKKCFFFYSPATNKKKEQIDSKSMAAQSSQTRASNWLIGKDLLTMTIHTHHHHHHTGSCSGENECRPNLRN